jgi:HK97 gp10 family phage protein
MSIDVRITRNALSGFSSQRGVYSELENTAAAVADHARSIVHVDSGELQGSIDHGGNGTDEVIAGATAEHAVYEELGTRFRSAHPYMVPAFEAETSGLPERIGRAVREAAGGS